MNTIAKCNNTNVFSPAFVAFLACCVSDSVREEIQCANAVSLIRPRLMMLPASIQFRYLEMTRRFTV